MFSSLSKEACLYAGADWLSSSVGQRVAGAQLTVIGQLRQKEKEKKEEETMFCAVRACAR